MKIMMLTNTFTPYAGGVVSSIRVTADALKKSGHSVKIVTFDFKEALTDSDEVDIIRLKCSFKFTYRQNSMVLPLRMAKKLRILIGEQKPDIIHIHHPFLLGPAAVRIARGQAIPIIFTHHTLYEHYAHYVPLPPYLTRPIIRFLVKKLSNNVDAIIAPSRSLATRLRTGGIKKSVMVLPSGIAADFFSQKFAYKPVKNICQLVVVSRFVPEKNLYFLLDVMYLLREAPFCLTLVGYGAELAALQEYAFKKLGLSQQVSFVVKPSRDELIAWYKKADIFVFSSRTETQGLVIAEAMAAGTPVIAVRGPGIDDVVLEGGNGFLVSSREEMAATIQKVFNDKNLWFFLQYNAWQTAQNYRTEVVVEKLIGHYNAIKKS